MDNEIPRGALKARVSDLEDALQRRTETMQAQAREVERLRFENGQLRSQNVRFRDASRVLIESLEGAWWRRASEAYDRLVIMVNDELLG